jgi:hypothetical protein
MSALSQEKTLRSELQEAAVSRQQLSRQLLLCALLYFALLCFALLISDCGKRHF